MALHRYGPDVFGPCQSPGRPKSGWGAVGHRRLSFWHWRATAFFVFMRRGVQATAAGYNRQLAFAIPGRNVENRGPSEVLAAFTFCMDSNFAEKGLGGRRTLGGTKGRAIPACTRKWRFLESWYSRELYDATPSTVCRVAGFLLGQAYA